MMGVKKACSPEPFYVYLLITTKGSYWPITTGDRKRRKTLGRKKNCRLLI